MWCGLISLYLNCKDQFYKQNLRVIQNRKNLKKNKVKGFVDFKFMLFSSLLLRKGKGIFRLC